LSVGLTPNEKIFDPVGPPTVSVKDIAVAVDDALLAENCKMPGFPLAISQSVEIA
jgi:hypothetical protein